MAGPQEHRARRLARDLDCQVFVSLKTGNVRAETPSGCRWRANAKRVLRATTPGFGTPPTERDWKRLADRMARGVMVPPSRAERVYS